jgi:(2Fe-2S) ferredoxin
MPLHEKHVFVCTGSDCRKGGAKKVCKALKRAVAASDLKKRVRVIEADCFDQCNHGPMVVVYPDAVWYAHMDADDAEELVRSHLVEGKPLRRRLYRRAHPEE